MRYTDRSRTELGWWCPEARYWEYEHEGVGLRPLAENKDLRFGLAIAEQTANIKRGKPVDLSAFLPGDERMLADGLLVGYSTIVWPRWLRDYDLIDVELECPKLLTPWLTYNSRPDTVMRRKADGSLWYGPEDKTTSWLDSLIAYGSSVQVHATGLSLEEMKGERVAGVMVQGLYKGFLKEGRLYHSLVYAYVKEGRAGIVPDQWSVKWVRGWERAPVSQYPGGVREWIKKLSPEDLAGIFPNSEPITLKREFVKDYLAQVVQRESEIEEWREGKRTHDATFPKHYTQCDSFSLGRKPCPSRDLCFNPTTRRFPMTMYAKRTPHHDNERENLK